MGFSCCLVDMVTSTSCYSADQALEFLDKSVEDEMEDKPYMEGSDDEYDNLLDSSNDTGNYFDEFDENTSMSTVPIDSIFTSPSTSHSTGDIPLAQISNNLLPFTPTSQQNPMPTSMCKLSTLASPSNQPLTTLWSTNLHPCTCSDTQPIQWHIWTNIYT